jgi:hypothetical protein
METPGSTLRNTIVSRQQSDQMRISFDPRLDDDPGKWQFWFMKPNADGYRFLLPAKHSVLLISMKPYVGI